MLENLNELVRENVQDAVVNNSEVPNEQNEAAIGAASSSIFDALKDQVSSGNISGLADIFNGGSTDGSAVVQNASSSFTEKLSGMGINAATAKTIAASVIPMIISKLTQKTADPNDSSFNITDILGKLGGGADGKFDVSDVIGMFGGGQSADPNAQNAGGGLLDKLKGMF
ncbi:hypothetical protein EZJ43_02575 [Pedobacter changchengzhani]|uniref:DUF937 domain-containing protein n=1 Tax=Pedobacter changchengzhani TaxID=2529274 RepID=A0A4R5MQA4_9SPHI|nr:DUF937 domain-containing protein [Pedobacter changchengzhani]TDG37994.1 hypothetical protein EZJ43_02575 [Pedobacter changchengzhani]